MAGHTPWNELRHKDRNGGMRIIFDGGPANGETMWTQHDPGDLLVPPGQPGDTPPYTRAGTTQDEAGPLVHYRFTGD